MYQAVRSCGVMLGVIHLSAVDCDYKSQSGQSAQTKNYNIGICWFSPKHAALRRKSKYCLAGNQDNVFEWSDMSTHIYTHYKNTTACTCKHLDLVQSGLHHHLTEMELVVAMK